jgi:hypothetical protein
MKACRAINNANLAIYPIDARGLVGPGDILPMFNATNPGRSSAGMATRVSMAYYGFNSTLETLRFLADMTGGRAFYNTNDITRCIRRACDDAGIHYVLRFYPRENEWNPQFHSINVKVNRPGVEVRFRRGFYVLPEPRLSAEDREARAMQAVNAPLESTVLTLTVRLAEPPSAGAPLRFELVLDPQQIMLKRKDGRVTGSLYVAFLQRTAGGKILQSRQERVNLCLTEATYQNALASGISLPRERTVEPGAEEMRTAVCDGAFDNIGAITVPLLRRRP